MRYELQRRVPSRQIFGKNADPARPYVWVRITSSNDKELLSDYKYKITDGEKQIERNYRIFDTEAAMRENRIIRHR